MLRENLGPSWEGTHHGSRSVSRTGCLKMWPCAWTDEGGQTLRSLLPQSLRPRDFSFSEFLFLSVSVCHHHTITPVATSHALLPLVAGAVHSTLNKRNLQAVRSPGRQNCFCKSWPINFHSQKPIFKKEYCTSIKKTLTQDQEISLCLRKIDVLFIFFFKVYL